MHSRVDPRFARYLALYFPLNDNNDIDIRDMGLYASITLQTSGLWWVTYTDLTLCPVNLETGSNY